MQAKTKDIGLRAALAGAGALMLTEALSLAIGAMASVHYLGAISVSVLAWAATVGLLVTAGFFSIYYMSTRSIQAAPAPAKPEGIYRSMVESTDDSLYMVDRMGKYLFINRRHLERLDLKDKPYTGLTYAQLHSEQDTKDFMAQVAQVFGTGRSSHYIKESQRDGRHFQLNLSPVTEPLTGKVETICVVSTDITHQKLMEQELRALSLTDALTGLYNRRGFFALAEQQMRLSYRLKKRLTLLYADLDGLKQINDTHGHAKGDLAIMEAGALLKSVYRDADIVARMGGDEFVVLFVDCKPEASQALESRLAEGSARLNLEGGLPFKLAMSTGMVHYDGQGAYSLDAMLEEADRCMYDRKKNKQSPIRFPGKVEQTKYTVAA